MSRGEPTSLLRIAREFVAYRRQQRTHSGSNPHADVDPGTAGTAETDERAETA